MTTMQLAAQASLIHMIKGGWVDICTINKVKESLGTIGDRQAYNTLSMLHCVRFDEMSPELRHEIPQLIRMAIGTHTIDLEVQSVPVESPKHTRSLLAIITGRSS